MRRWSHEGGHPCFAGPYPGQARWDRHARLLSCVIAHRRETGTGCSACALAVPTLGHKSPQPRHSDVTLILAHTGPSLAAARMCHSWRTVARARGGRLKGRQMVRHQSATRAHASLRHQPLPYPLAVARQTSRRGRPAPTTPETTAGSSPNGVYPSASSYAGGGHGSTAPPTYPVPPTRQVGGPATPVDLLSHGS